MTDQTPPSEAGEPGKPEAAEPADNLHEGHPLLEPEEAETAGIPSFSAHWQLYIPTLVVAVLYTIIWLGFVLTGNGGTNLARLFVIVMTVGVPLLAVQAFLRFQTIRVQVYSDEVLCHPGWPRDMPYELPVSVIREVRVRRGLAGRLFGGGTLVFDLTTGEPVAVADLGDPEGAAEAVRAVTHVPA